MRVPLLLMCLYLGSLAAPVQSAAVSWSAAFESEQDTVLFLAADGSLVRATFNLAHRETLWTPRSNEHLVRLKVSPDGTRAAWLARHADGDTTELWIVDRNHLVLRLRYFAMEARRYGDQHSEPDHPTVEDEGARGARFIQVSGLSRRSSSNSLAWTPDSRSVIVGYDGGIAVLPATEPTRHEIPGAGAIEMEALFPSSMFIVEAVLFQELSKLPTLTQLDLRALIAGGQPYVVRDGKRVEYSRGRFVLGSGAAGWRACPAPALPKRHLVAGHGSRIWWADGNIVRSMNADSCEPREVFRAPERIIWLQHQPFSKSLLWVRGRELMLSDETGGNARAQLKSDSPYRAVIDGDFGAFAGFLTRDELVVYDIALVSDPRTFKLAGLEPCAIFIGPEHEIHARIDCGTGLPRVLARADAATNRLVEIDTPPVRGGTFHATPGRGFILLYAPSGSPPKTLHAYDVRKETWIQVQNPGFRGWEPMRPAWGSE